MSFSALTLLVGRQERHLACKKQWGMVEVSTGWSGWSGTQPDGRCLPLLIFPCTIKSRSFLLTPAHPGGPGKRTEKWWLCVFQGYLCHEQILNRTLLCYSNQTLSIDSGVARGWRRVLSAPGSNVLFDFQMN